MKVEHKGTKKVFQLREPQTWTKARFEALQLNFPNATVVVLDNFDEIFVFRFKDLAVKEEDSG